MVHAVLRESPSALAWSSSERNPTSIRTCPSSRILADWRAFISAMTGRAGLVCVDSVRFGGAAMFFSPERTLVAGTSTAENLLTTPTFTTPTLCYCAQFRCTRATQCCSLRQAPLSIELRANYRITEKSIGLEGFSPPIASWLVDYLLTISANRSLNQPSSKQFAVSTHACMLFFGQSGEFDVPTLRPSRTITATSSWAAAV